MTPGTRLLEALTAWIDAPDRFARDGLEADVIDAFGAVSTARALYPAAHAIGDRVSVVYPDERKPDYEDFTGTVVGVEFTDTGVDYRVLGDGDPDYTVVEAGFVQSAPKTTITFLNRAGEPTEYDPAGPPKDLPPVDPDKMLWAPLTPDMPVTSTNTCVIPGRVLVQSHTDEHGVQSVATQPLCPSRSEGSPLLMCEGLADHAGPHHALARTVTW